MQEHLIMRQTVITPQLATAASMLIRLAHPENQSLHRALAKAEPLLMTQPWRVDAGVLRIVSHSHPNQTHTCDGQYCECETKRGVCWHIAGWHILSTLAAAGVCCVADLPLPAVLDDDELPASFLDGDFDAFEDTTLLPSPEPFRPRIVTHEPMPGTDYARAQAACDELFAA